MISKLWTVQDVAECLGVPVKRFYSLRVLAEAGIDTPSYATVKRPPAEIRERKLAEQALGCLRGPCRRRGGAGTSRPRFV